MSLAALQPGVLFAGRYRIERLLKSGGMGAVHVVTHAEFGGRFALKVMRPEIVADATLRERFKQEAQISSRLESSFVVKVTDAGVDAGTGMPFIVMELLRGQELGELLKARGRLTPTEVVTYIGQVARALDRAHAQGIVHRDLKPENLFLATSDDEPPRIKILDFGIAKILQSATHADSTLAGGTALYMAPEQTRKSREIGPWTDVWALGLIAYTLLTGRSYWESETIFELYAEIIAAEFEPATIRAGRLGVTLPPRFDAWFSRCVASTAAGRMASAGEAAAALASVFATASPVADPRAELVATLPMAPGDTPILAQRTEPSTSSVATAPGPAAPSATPVGASDTMPLTTPSIADSGALIPPFSETTPPKLPIKRSVWLLGLGGGSVALIIALRLVTGGSTDSTKNGDPTAAPSQPTSPTSLPSVPGTGPAKPAQNPKNWRKRVEELNPFVVVDKTALQRHEVTVEEYASYLDSLSASARASATPLFGWSDLDLLLRKGDPVPKELANLPLGWLSHARAKRFCEALDARLPTAKDWAAPLAGKKFPWGNTPGVDGLSLGVAHTLGPFGIVSMAAVESAPKDTASGVRDLFGSLREWGHEVEGGFAVVRGASAFTAASEAASAFATPTVKEADEGEEPAARAKELAGADIGFRCARDHVGSSPAVAKPPAPPDPTGLPAEWTKSGGPAMGDPTVK